MSTENQYIVSQSRNPNLSAPKVDRTSPNQVMQKFNDSWWTGVHPEKCVGFDRNKNYLRALPLLNLNICNREDVLNYFDNTWTLTEILFSGIKHESTYSRPPYHQLRHPMIFYYGHTAVVFMNKLRLAGIVDKPVDLYLEKILETGVDEMSWDDMSKNEMEWPSVSTVKDYRQKIYNLIKQIILTHPDLDPNHRKNSPDRQLNNDKHPLWALFMGIEHEKIHFETSSVLIRELPLDLVETPKYWAPLGERLRSTSVKPVMNEHFPENKWISFKGEAVTYGKPVTALSYGWDNEYGTRQTQTQDFQLTQNLITNGEYYEFVSTGAYVLDQYWQPEGLMWRKYRNTKRPTFWVGYGPEGLHDYKLRTIFEIVDMPWDWPAEVNYHEAKAYCAWKQEKDKSHLHYRLITEAEFTTVKNKLTENTKIDFVLQNKNYLPSINEDFNSTFNYTETFNLNYSYSSPRSVDFVTQPQMNLRDFMGNVWHWAEDQFNPLDQFKTNYLYDDFSTPCFDGKHQMILGGSFISCGHEASIWARFHFRPHFYQHSGFRIAATLDGSSDNSSVKLLQAKSYVHQTRQNVLDQMKIEGWWKEVYQPLELNSQSIKSFFDETVQAIVQLDEQRKQTEPAGESLDLTNGALKPDYRWTYQSTKNFPEYSENYTKLIEFIKNDVVPLGQHPGHSGYMAYVAGAANSVSAAAHALALSINQFTGHHSLAPGMVNLENEVIRWFLTMTGLHHKTAGGILTSGGSQANLSALVAARQSKFKSSDLSQARFYASEMVHHCLGKSLAFLGFPMGCLRLVSVDHHYKMNTEELRQCIEQDIKSGLTPVAVIATAGSTNTGSIDSLIEISKITEKHNIWFHVDGAYGALFMLTQNGADKLDGLHLADSIALDPHKALQMPYGVGCLLVKERESLRYAYAGQSTYMPPKNEYDYADYSLELSRDPRGLRVWLPIKTLGIAPFKLNLEEKLKLTEFIYTELKKIEQIRIETKPELTITTFALENNERTQKLLTFINQSQKFYLTGCTIKDRFYIRICLLGFRSHYVDVLQLLNLIREGLKSI